jgi:hypothetical protein
MVPHNIIKLQLPDGREVSIIQNGHDRKGCAYGDAELFTCEVYVEGEEYLGVQDVRGYLTLRDLMQYLTQLSNDWTLSKESQND